MSKAVLIMDMPECCRKCPLCSIYEACMANKMKKTDVNARKSKPDWCPLRELPDEHNIDATWVGEGWALFNKGWNACLDAVTGEEQE